MTSNMFSRFVPPAQGTRSFYEELRNRGDTDNVDDQNLREQFHDYDIENDIEGGDSRITVDSTVNLVAGAPRSSAQTPSRGRNRDRWHSQDEDGDDDVPASLLVEPHDPELAPRPGQTTRPPRVSRTGAIPGPSNARARAQWETTQAQQRLHDESSEPARGSKSSPLPAPVVSGVSTGTARDKAAWRWVNVSNLDYFMLDVYNYYDGSGMKCILLDRLLHLVETTFVAVFTTFLTQCVDHSKISGAKSLEDIAIPHCTRKMSGLWNLGLWIFTFYFIWKSVQFVVDLRRLSHLRDFYVQLLGIPDQDMQTVSWQDVVGRIMALRDTHAETATNLGARARKYIGSQSKKRLDAHDVANRLMRKENFLIAMINKDILNFNLPIPFVGYRNFYSRTLQWYLNFAIVDFVFDSRGQVNQEFLKPTRRGTLSTKLRQRFVFAGVLNLVFAPFVLAYILVFYFFSTFFEFRSDPSKISARRYTPLAEWKFREFNELPHLFHERLNMSYPFATRYLDQFPKKATERLARTFAFVSGALAAVLTVASLMDPEIFRLEITPEGTVLFWIGILGTVWAFARGRVSEDESVFDPEYAMRNVIEYTHYVPDHWDGRLHSFDVMQEFSELYKLKPVIFLEEVLGIITTPFLLLLTLPGCSDQIIDFFREFTVHVDGLGYVCSFAVFNFKKGAGQTGAGAGAGVGPNNDAREDYYSTKHGKMAASYYGFLDNYVINPKTGIPGHMPPGMRHHFHPPPAFPPLNSPTLAADMHGSRAGRGDRDRTRMLGPAGQLQAARTPRFGATMAQPSPMTSMLLDPHHQPAVVPNFGGRSFHRARQGRGGFGGDASIIEESFEGSRRQNSQRKDGEEEDVYESGGGLGESVWETSPTKALSRENSGVQAGEPQGGVLDLIYQFQQAHRVQRPGGAL